MLKKFFSHPVIKASSILAGIVVCEALAFGLYKILRKTGCTLDI